MWLRHRPWPQCDPVGADVADITAMERTPADHRLRGRPVSPGGRRCVPAVAESSAVTSPTGKTPHLAVPADEFQDPYRYKSRTQPIHVDAENGLRPCDSGSGSSPTTPSSRRNGNSGSKLLALGIFHLPHRPSLSGTPPGRVPGEGALRSSRESEHSWTPHPRRKRRGCRISRLTESPRSTPSPVRSPTSRRRGRRRPPSARR